MEPGDLEEGMTAAAAIGDDTIQRAGRGVVVPESFTHGTSAQRQEALMRGYRGGTLAACESYTAGHLSIPSFQRKLEFQFCAGAKEKGFPLSPE